jgi:RES domain-containing protein
VKEDTRKSKSVVLIEKGQNVPLDRPVTNIVEDVKGERENELQYIEKIIDSFQFDLSTIIEIQNEPAGRALSEKFQKDPLNPIGSQKRGGRFNFKSFEKDAVQTIYFADREETALCEVTKNLTTREKFIYIPVNIYLQKAWDLRGQKNCSKNGIDHKVLLDQWDYDQDVLNISSYSQKIGEFAYAHDEIEAIIYDSPRLKDGFCFAVFPEKLYQGSKILISNPRSPDEIIAINGTKPFAVVLD